MARPWRGSVVTRTTARGCAGRGGGRGLAAVPTGRGYGSRRTTTSRGSGRSSRPRAPPPRAARRPPCPPTCPRTRSRRWSPAAAPSGRTCGIRGASATSTPSCATCRSSASSPTRRCPSARWEAARRAWQVSEGPRDRRGGPGRRRAPRRPRGRGAAEPAARGGRRGEPAAAGRGRGRGRRGGHLGAHPARGPGGGRRRDAAGATPGGRVVLIGTAGPDAAAGDAYLLARHRALGAREGPVVWLGEHAEHGLPTLDELVGLLREGARPASGRGASSTCGCGASCTAPPSATPAAPRRPSGPPPRVGRYLGAVAAPAPRTVPTATSSWPSSAESRDGAGLRRRADRLVRHPRRAAGVPGLAVGRPVPAGVELRASVLDNASADGSAEMVERDFPSVRLVRSPVNLGFGIATNRLAATSTASHLLLLNPDTRVEGPLVGPLLAALEADPAIVVAGPRLVFPGGEVQTSSERFPTLRFELAKELRGTKLQPLLRRVFDVEEVLGDHRRTAARPGAPRARRRLPVGDVLAAAARGRRGLRALRPALPGLRRGPRPVQPAAGARPPRRLRPRCGGRPPRRREQHHGAQAAARAGRARPLVPPSPRGPRGAGLPAIVRGADAAKAAGARARGAAKG